MGWVAGSSARTDEGSAEQASIAMTINLNLGRLQKEGGRGIEFLSLFNLDAALDEVNNCAKAD